MIKTFPSSQFKPKLQKQRYNLSENYCVHSGSIVILTIRKAKSAEERVFLLMIKIIKTSEFLVFFFFWIHNRFSGALLVYKSYPSSSAVYEKSFEQTIFYHIIWYSELSNFVNPSFKNLHFLSITLLILSCTMNKKLLLYATNCIFPTEYS